MIVIRPATRADGLAIEALLESEKINIGGIDWSDNEHFWNLAVIDEEIVGCIQVIGSRPVGYIGFLAVAKKVRKHSVTFKLCESAFAALREMGVLAVTYFVSHDMSQDDWEKVVRRVGSITLHSSGTQFIRSTGHVMAFHKARKKEVVVEFVPGGDE